MTAVTPQNQGAAITSCSVAPALPSGLTLSQSDCSVSGTPTAPSPPTNYLITPKSGTSVGNTLSLGLAVQPAKVKALSCQSDTFCLHTLMPIWSQGDPGLVAYVSTRATT